MSALEVIGFSTEEIASVYQILASILLLVGFKGRGSLLVGLRDFIDTAIYIDILFPDKVSIFQSSIDFFNFLIFLANFIEKSDVTISENTEH